MVVLPNIDGKIWHLPSKVAEMIDEYQTTNRLAIELNQEGPCMRSLGLVQTLDELSERFGWNKSNISIVTNNLLESHDNYVIKKMGPLYLDSVKEFVRSSVLPQKDFDNILHFGIFVGRSNWLRLWLSSVVYDEFQDKSIQTFHYDPKVDYHKEHLGFDDLIFFLAQDSDIARKSQNFIANCPILIDDQIPDYPIITPEHFGISKVYHKFFVEIVCETYCQGNTFYPTEKIWRPIACKTPFIIQGPKQYYHNLHRLGFKTFSNWWDEGFTNDDYEHQPHEIIKVLRWLASLTKAELESLYIDIQSVLDHNHKVLMNLDPITCVVEFAGTSR